MQIALMGTFDVENYGDLLFPSIADRRLRGLIPPFELVPVSPAGGRPILRDSMASVPYDEFLNRLDRYAAVIIGGGNIIHTGLSTLDVYNKGLLPFTGYADLWLGTAIALQNDPIPILWNAPGIPETLRTRGSSHVSAALKRTDYLSVRDSQSAAFISEIAPTLETHVVPDSAWDVGTFWSRPELRRAYTDTFSKLCNSEPPERTIAFHLNSRYAADTSPKQLAIELDQICRTNEARGILLALGRCHGDDVIATSIAREMTTRPLVIPKPESLLQIASCIAYCSAYVGSSLHGFITATCFLKPAVLVASSSKPKFPGLLKSVGLEFCLTESWTKAGDLLLDVQAKIDDDRSREIIAAQQSALNAHWIRIGSLIRGRDVSGKPRDQRKGENQSSLMDYRFSILQASAIELLARHAGSRHKSLAKFTDGQNSDLQQTNGDEPTRPVRI